MQMSESPVIHLCSLALSSLIPEANHAQPLALQECRSAQVILFVILMLQPPSSSTGGFALKTGKIYNIDLPIGFGDETDCASRWKTASSEQGPKRVIPLAVILMRVGLR
jgi:hypothetical protein